MTYTDSDLTQWFNLSEQKPWEPGVYEVESSGLSGGVKHAHWDGVKFKYISHTGVRRARDMMVVPGGGWKVELWRGLNYDPSLPKRLARRTDPATSHDAAKQAVKSGSVATNCSKIYAALKKHGAMNVEEISRITKLRRSVCFRRMSDLRQDGKASRTGEKRGGQSVWNAI